MPIFEFHCHKCKKDFESLILPNDPVQCPDCRSIGDVIEKKVTHFGSYKWSKETHQGVPKRYKNRGE